MFSCNINCDLVRLCWTITFLYFIDYGFYSIIFITIYFCDNLPLFAVAILRYITPFGHYRKLELCDWQKVYGDFGEFVKVNLSSIPILFMDMQMKYSFLTNYVVYEIMLWWNWLEMFLKRIVYRVWIIEF